MKNKNLLVIIGIALAYHFYKMYAKKPNAPVLKTSATPNLLYPESNQVNANNVPSQFLVDSVRTAEAIDTPNTYQTYYGKLNGMNNKVPTTC